MNKENKDRWLLFIIVFVSVAVAVTGWIALKMLITQRRNQELAKRAECAENLKTIGEAFRQYAEQASPLMALSQPSAATSMSLRLLTDGGRDFDMALPASQPTGGTVPPQTERIQEVPDAR